MMRAAANVSAIEHRILAESLRRVARVRPWVALVIAEVLEAEDGELDRLALTLTPDEALFGLNVVWAVVAELGGRA